MELSRKKRKTKDYIVEEMLQSVKENNVIRLKDLRIVFSENFNGNASS